VKIIKKIHFSLPEILISLALVSILLSSLSYFFYQISILNIASEKIEKQAFLLRNIEYRLMKILPKTISVNDAHNDFVFFTGKSGFSGFKPGNSYLLFTFDNKINLVDPQYSNHVIGRIFLDPENNLSLAITPSLKRWEEPDKIPTTREVLMEGVDSLDFSFFTGPHPDTPENNNEQPIPHNTWVSEWRREYKSLPVMVKIEISFKESEKKDKRTMIFPLPNATQKITYGM